MKKSLLCYFIVFLMCLTGGITAATEFDFNGSVQMNAFINNNVQDISLLGGTKIVTKVKVNDKLSGEIDQRTTLNRAYFNYKFNNMVLTVGKTYSPIDFYYSYQAWAGNELYGAGYFYGGTVPLLALKVDNTSVAVVQSSIVNDNVIPKVQVAQAISVADTVIDLGVEYDAKPKKWQAGIGIKQKIEDLLIAGSGYTTEEDGSLGVVAVVRYLMNKIITLEAGYGSWKPSETATAIVMYYGQLKYALDDGFYLIPEIGSSVKETNYYGMKIQIDF
ncbi:hypothetical protein ACFL2K_03600 [Candidatus Margulisiibacteriota bacterium]